MGKIYQNSEEYRNKFEEYRRRNAPVLRNQFIEETVDDLMVSNIKYYMDPSLTKGLNAAGMMSAGEVELEHRMTKVLHSFAIQNPDFRNLLTSMTREFQGRPGSVYSDMTNMSTQVKRDEWSAMLHWDEAESEKFEERMNQGNEAIRNSSCATLVSCMEYAAGLSDTYPIEFEDDERVKAIFEERYIDSDKLKQMHQSALTYDLERPLESVYFNFVNPTDLAEQQKQLDSDYLFNQATYGTIDFENVTVAENVLQESLMQSAADTLDPLFQNAEKMVGVDRGRCIIVGGKTIEEIIRQEHLQESMEDEDCPDFETYYRDNFKEITHRAVAAGMAADKRVEVFIPDKAGKIGEPVQMTAQGVAPTELTPVTMNAWQKFSSKFGFYKDTLARQSEYETTIQKREEVKQSVEAARTKQYRKIAEKYAEWNPQDDAEYRDLKLGSRMGFSFTRSGFGALAVAGMLNAGHDVEKVFDPNELLVEKRRIGALVTRKDMQEDKAWFAEQIVGGREALQAYTEKRMNQADQIEDIRYREGDDTFFKAQMMAFELSQECEKGGLKPRSSIRNSFEGTDYMANAAFEHEREKLLNSLAEKGDDNEVQQVANRLNQLTDQDKKTLGIQADLKQMDTTQGAIRTFKIIGQAISTEDAILNDRSHTEHRTNAKVMSDLLVGKMVMDFSKDKFKNLEISDLKDILGLSAMMGSEREKDQLNKSFDANAGALKIVREELEKGTFFNNFDVQYGRNKYDDIQVKLELKEGKIKEAIATPNQREMETKQQGARTR